MLHSLMIEQDLCYPVSPWNMENLGGSLSFLSEA